MVDLSGLCQNYINLYVSSIFHKIYLKVNKSGTEAAAVTEVIIMEREFIDYNKKKIYKMKVNRLLLFLLKNSKFPQRYDMFLMSKIEIIDWYSYFNSLIYG